MELWCRSDGVAFASKLARTTHNESTTAPIKARKPGHDHFPFNFQNDAALTKTRKTLKTGWRGESSSSFLILNSKLQDLRLCTTPGVIRHEWVGTEADLYPSDTHWWYVGFNGFLCVSAKIRRRRIWHLRGEGGERQHLSQVLNPQMAKGLSPWRWHKGVLSVFVTHSTVEFVGK